MGIRSALSGLLCLFLLQYCASSHAAVQGHVIDSSQNPIVGALVTFTDESNPANSFSGYTDADGWYEIEITSPPVIEDPPVEFQLSQNFPNPFNPSTTIPFSLDTSSHVSLTIYSITGQKIATVIDNTMDEGNHTTGWDGMDDDGNHVSSGVYLYRLKAGKHTKTRKMLLLDGGRIPGGDMSSRPGPSYPVSTKKMTGETTYIVAVTHDFIEPYKETDVSIFDGQMLDFVISVKRSTVINGITFAVIPGGTFLMGDEVGDLYGASAHTVTISGFVISIHETTNAQYAEYLTEALASGDIIVSNSDVTGAKGVWKGKRYYRSSYSDSPIKYRDGVFSIRSGKENLPVYNVSWYGAKSFAEYYGFDIPTEAEWEYACRGGQQYKYGTYNGTIGKGKANYDDYVGAATNVGSYPANPFGLFDMSGNVYEWCHDWYGPYSNEESHNPTGAKGNQRIKRGGYWASVGRTCRSACRLFDKPGKCSETTGFRVVRRPNGEIY